MNTYSIYLWIRLPKGINKNQTKDDCESQGEFLNSQNCDYRSV